MNEKLVEEIQQLEIALENTENAQDTNFGNEMASSEELPNVTEANNPEDVAAVFFSMNQKKLSMLLDKLSAKQLRRVIFNACSYPFVDKQYTPRTDEEKSAAYLVHEMVLNKTIMQLSFEMQKADEASKSLTVSENSDSIINNEVKNENS